MPPTTGADAVSAHPATPTPAPLIKRLGPVLNDPRFPAAAWEILTHAELYGADATTRAALRALPTGRYRTLRAVAAVLAADHARTPVAAQHARSKKSPVPQTPLPR